MKAITSLFNLSSEIEIDYPYEFTCPIGYNLIKEPVIDEYGYTYDKINIDQWLKQKKICPLNNKPYNNSNLVPNRALKESIDKFIEENNLQGKKIKVKEISYTNIKEFIFNKNEFEQNLIFENRIVNSDENFYLHLKLKIPNIKSNRKHSIILLDTSGSMGQLAKLKNSSGIEEDQGLSLLKVSIHAIKTLLSSFEDGDYISIITFNSISEIIENLIEFNKNEKVRIFNKLDSIQVSGSTNLENGLEECYKICSAYPDLFNTVILFTDGRPNSCRSTWDRILNNYESTYNIFPKIDSIGFSYDIDVDSLKLISSHSKGTYCFIPDSGMISDIMINYSARYKNMIINKNCVEFNIKLPAHFEYDNKLIYGVEEIVIDDNKINLKTGSLISDQEKNILIPITPTGKDSSKEFENKVTVNINDVMITKKDKLILEDYDISNEVIRYNFLNLLNFIQKQAKRTQYDICRTEILKFLDEYDMYSDNLIIKDLEGQVLESVSNAEYWNNWGYKYIVSLYFAHNNEYCNNYKDFGVQKYATSEFENLREIYSEMFNKIPPPKPDVRISNSTSSTSSHRSNVDMSSFNNRGGVCFTGDNLVYLKFENEIYKDKIENLKKNDLIAIDVDENGKFTFDIIECIIKTDFNKYDNGKTYICNIPVDQKYGNKFLNISPLHPLIKDNKWVHPKDLVKPILTECNYVYSFLLKNRNNIIVNDIKCSTLAHGIIGNVIGHDYFGSEKIVNDLKKLKGWDIGLITITPNDIKRNKNTNFIEEIHQ